MYVLQPGQLRRSRRSRQGSPSRHSSSSCIILKRQSLQLCTFLKQRWGPKAASLRLLSRLALPVEPAAANPPESTFHPGAVPAPISEAFPPSLAPSGAITPVAAAPGAAAPVAAVATTPVAVAASAHPAEAAATRLVQRGAHPGRIGEGAAVVGGATGAAREAEVALGECGCTQHGDTGLG